MQKLLQKRRWSLATLLVITLLYSCQQEEVVKSTKIQQSKNFVQLDEVTAIATVLEYPITTTSDNAAARTNGVTSIFKDIENVLEIPDENGDPSFYIINYKDEGFIMLSADNRTNPIRAFSMDEKFPIEAGKLPNGLVGWLVETSEMIHQIRILDEVQTQGVAMSWDICEMQNTVCPPGDDCGCSGGPSTRRERAICDNRNTTVGPLLSTEWGQWNGYNNFSGRAGDCPNFPNSRPPSGCVATAMAQVMKFHEHPSKYNWNSMPDNSGSNETAQLMRDIADAIDMDWNCNGSRAYMKDAASAFSCEFGYQNVYYTDFNLNTLKQQLRQNKPVLLSGYQNKKCFLWWCSYSDGHAWVCDGYRSTFHCRTRATYLYLHMNWGWGLRTKDSYYAYNDWNSGNYSFNHNKEMIININPQI